MKTVACSWRVRINGISFCWWNASNKGSMSSPGNAATNLTPSDLRISTTASATRMMAPIYLLDLELLEEALFLKLPYKPQINEIRGILRFQRRLFNEYPIGKSFHPATLGDQAETYLQTFRQSSFF